MPAACEKMSSSPRAQTNALVRPFQMGVPTAKLEIDWPFEPFLRREIADAKQLEAHLFGAPSDNTVPVRL